MGYKNDVRLLLEFEVACIWFPTFEKIAKTKVFTINFYFYYAIRFTFLLIIIYYIPVAY